MKDIGLTHSKGMNMPNMPKAGPSAPGPKATNGGVSLQKGYNTVSPPYSAPHAVTPND